ncbi:MAG: FKBP-type peptidyl-prolyl cis-trans isomerase [Planctomycetaceae bacterium]
MLLKKWVGVALAGLILMTAAISTAEDAKEVEFPKLPKGAGEISENAPKTFTTTKSGLKYRILRDGKGNKPQVTQNVEVHYHGWLDDGSVFDSSYKKRRTAKFALNEVIPGWTEGLQLVGEGGMIELYIPYKLGYGDAGYPPVIPGRTDLHFVVELLDVK